MGTQLAWQGLTPEQWVEQFPWRTTGEMVYNLEPHNVSELHANFFGEVIRIRELKEQK